VIRPVLPHPTGICSTARDARDITSQECFYRKVGALSDLSNGPFVAALDADANLSDCDEAHIVTRG
jgi:hypothetical protein